MHVVAGGHSKLISWILTRDWCDHWWIMDPTDLERQLLIIRMLLFIMIIQMRRQQNLQRNRQRTRQELSMSPNYNPKSDSEYHQELFEKESELEIDCDCESAPWNLSQPRVLTLILPPDQCPSPTCTPWWSCNHGHIARLWVPCRDRAQNWTHSLWKPCSSAIQDQWVNLAYVSSSLQLHVHLIHYDLPNLVAYPGCNAFTLYLSESKEDFWLWIFTGHAAERFSPPGWWCANSQFKGQSANSGKTIWTEQKDSRAQGRLFCIRLFSTLLHPEFKGTLVVWSWSRVLVNFRRMWCQPCLDLVGFLVL